MSISFCPKLVLIGLLILSGCAGVAAQDQDATKLKQTQQVIDDARHAICKKVKLNEIVGISAVWQSRLKLDNGDQYTGNTAHEVLLPDKVRTNITYKFPTNEALTTEVLNGERARSESKTIVNGTVLAAMGSADQSERTLRRLQQSYGLFLLRTLLVSPQFLPVEFSFIGEAESKDGRADVLEAQCPGRFKARFFFDKETHLLLLISYKIKNKTAGNPSSEVKMFLSDYRNVDGLLVAHHLSVEIDGEVMEDSELKSFAVNPSFKTNEFEIK